MALTINQHGFLDSQVLSENAAANYSDFLNNQTATYGKILDTLLLQREICSRKFHLRAVEDMVRTCFQGV